MATFNPAESSGAEHSTMPRVIQWESLLGERQLSAKSASLRSSTRTRASSMAPANIHQQGTALAPPSLGIATECTPTETSIRTGLAPHLDGIPLLEDNDGVLQQPHATTRAPVYECPFWFLSCNYMSHDKDEWETHSESHFRGEEPPRFSQCPLCEWTFQSADGLSAWKQRMQHIALSHCASGHTLRTSRPDFNLFQHLWRKRLIDDEDFRELHGVNHSLSQSPRHLVINQRRDDRPRRLGRQNVSTQRVPAGDLNSAGFIQDSWRRQGMEMSHDAVGNVVIPNTHEPDQNSTPYMDDDRGDSGYGSLSYVGQMSSRLGDDTATIRTMLSDVSLVFQLPYERESLISAFVRDFYEDAKLCDLPEQRRARAIARLSELLKMFSVRLDGDGLSQAERDAKDFIRQQRVRITDQVRKLYSPDDTSSANALRDLPQEDMSVEERIALQIATVDEESGNDEVAIPPRYQEVRSFLLQSSAYKLLVKRICSAAFLTESKHNVRDQIVQDMNSLFSKLRKCSNTPKTIYEIRFALEWNVSEFLQDQAYDCCLSKAIESAIVITGDIADAQAMTCGQYMEQVWPGTGRDLMKILQRAVAVESQFGHPVKAHKRPLEFQLGDGTKLEFKFAQSSTLISAEGNQASLTELAEQFAWLGSALRPSLTMNGITTFVPWIEDSFISDDQASAYVQVGFLGTTTSKYEITATSSSPNCWQKMFRNPIVVQGFPIMARDNGERGLQIPFPLLVTLANVQHLTSYCSSVILKGLVSMLVSTEKSNRSMMWHFLCNETGERMKYSAFRHRCQSWLSVDQIQLEQIASSDLIHFVGWSPRIARHFGTDQNDYEIIDYAGAKKCSAGFAIEQKLTISASRYIGISGAVVRGNRDRAEFLKYTGYSAQIEAACKIPVLFYDTATQRGWMTDGASALLHTARTQVIRKPYGGENSLFNNPKYNVSNFNHPSSERGSEAAKYALLDEANMKHKVLREFDGYAEEKIDWDEHDHEKNSLEGSKLDESKSKKGSQEIYKTICFKDLVCQTWSTLEQIYDRQMDQVMDHTTTPIQNPFDTLLEGYEFMGIVSAKHMLTRRNIILKANGSAWTPFIKGIHAVTLFGKHFGNLYSPTDVTKSDLCNQWATVPCGQEYLVAPLSLLREIRQNSIEEGEVDKLSHELVSGMFWFPSKDLYKQCGPQCSHINLDRVQKISLKGKQVMNTALLGKLLSCEGAIIVGENSILNAKRMKEASQRKPQTDLLFDDSGLGSSIEASNIASTSVTNSDISQLDTQSTPLSTQSGSSARGSSGTSGENDIQMSRTGILQPMSDSSEILSSQSVSPPLITPTTVVSEQAHSKIQINRKNGRRWTVIWQQFRARFRQKS